MEPSQLQLVLNVVMITGVSSLAAYCYLLRKENQKLVAERRTDSESERRDGHQMVRAVIDQDIRNFAAGRRSGWVKTLSSSIPASKQEDSGR